MAGLVPATHVLQTVRMAGGYVYFLTNRPNGILYVGVTNDRVRRVFEHRSGFVDGFTKRYGLKRLVYFEGFDDIRDAIQRVVWDRLPKQQVRSQIRFHLKSGDVWTFSGQVDESVFSKQRKL